jgi:hypothetical protein
MAGLVPAIQLLAPSKTWMHESLMSARPRFDMMGA